MEKIPHLVFGRTIDDLEESAARLSEQLGVALEGRDSDYWGGDYYLARSVAGVAEECRLHRNTDLYGGEPIFSEYSAAQLLLHVHGAEEPDRIADMARAAGFEPLTPGVST
ncbi:MAG: hypothetical protein AAFV62_08175 [Pseudomonadota bacterium]